MNDAHTTDWTNRAASARWRVRPFVDGMHRNSASEDEAEHRNPATGEIQYRFPVGDAADIDDAVGIARERFEGGVWADKSPARRAEVLVRLADLIIENAPELALLDSLEMGKPITAALQDATYFAPNYLRSYAASAEHLYGDTTPVNSRRLALNFYEPRGVVGAITPWNFPVVNAVFKVGPALAAGNSLVLKPSELAPSSTIRLAELALQAGIPEGVFNVVPGLGSTVGAALASHPDIDFVSFTGSTLTGQKIQEMAGRSNGKPLMLECGGKSPQIVFEDIADLDAVADAVAQGFLWNEGQVCVARTRLVVHEELKDALLEKVLERIKRCVVGDPLDGATTFGPLASTTQRDRVARFIHQGVAEGATAVLLGKVREGEGCFMLPTVFDRTDRSMTIVREEIFGPVLCVQTFKTESEAFAIANDSKYGLAASVWTGNLGCGMRAARVIRAGTVVIRCSTGSDPDWEIPLSYEPHGMSGHGSELGRKSLETYSTLKSVSFIGQG